MARKKKKKSINRRIVEILIFISILVILLGTYLLYLSNSKRIFLQSVNNLTESFKNIEEFEPEFRDYEIISDLTINTTGKIDLEKYENRYYKVLSNIINNYNDTIANIAYTSNKTNKELYIDYQTNINKKDLISGKYLIKDNTEYYQVSNITNNYINNGNNTYFESFRSNTKESDNLIYVKNKFNKLFIKNINDDYFTRKTTSNTKITLTLDNKRINKIYKETIKDLKQDKKANEIITGYDRDFFKKKINDVEYLDKDKKLYITIYTDNITYSTKKYEVKYKSQKLTNENNKFKLYKNNKLKFSGDITNKEKRLSVNIYNKNNTKIGSLSISRKKNKKKLVFNIKDRGLKNSIVINTSKRKVNKKEYKQNISINIAGEKDNEGVYSIILNLNNKIIPAKKIRVDVSESELASSLEDAKKKEIINKKQNIIDKIIKQEEK